MVPVSAYHRAAADAGHHPRLHLDDPGHDADLRADHLHHAGWAGLPHRGADYAHLRQHAGLLAVRLRLRAGDCVWADPADAVAGADAVPAAKYLEITNNQDDNHQTRSNHRITNHQTSVRSRSENVEIRAGGHSAL